MIYLKIVYKVFGTSINYLIENKILEVPDFIKIDVDGIDYYLLKECTGILEIRL